MSPSIRSLLAPLALCALLAACNRNDENAVLDAARAHYDKREFKSAIIVAKSALQRNEKNAQARLLLGRALLETGDHAAAAVELRKALEGGVDAAVATPLLAQALLGQGEWRSVVMQFNSTTLADPTATAVLQTAVATAQARLGDRPAALQAVEAALRLAPQHVPAQLLQARLTAAGGDPKGALALVDSVLARDPKEPAALLLSGDLQALANADTDAVLSSYRRAADADPKAVHAHAAAIAIMLRSGDEAGARAQFEKMKAAEPNHAETRLIEGNLALLAKDYAKARQVAQLLLKPYPREPRVLQLAGAAELMLNNLPQAESFLTQAVKAVPRAPLPRRLLAEVQLRSRQPQRALESLAPLLAAKPDARTLTLAGQAWRQVGDAKKSEDAFARAAKLDPKATTARTALALGQMAKGDMAGGMAELEHVAAGDAGAGADLSLVAARLHAKDTAGALKAIDALEKKLPGKPIAHTLRGKVLAMRNDPPAAQASYEKSLAIDPLYLPAVVGLAELDLGAGKPDAARQRLRELIKADPKNHRAHATLAQLMARTGAPPSEVAAQLGQAVQAAPTEAAPRIVLVNYLLAQRNANAALTAAQNAVAALPTDTALQERLGAAQLAAGEPQQAVATFAKIAAANGSRAAAHQQLAEAQFAAKDLPAAQRSLERAAEIEPGNVPAQLGLARLAVAQKQYAAALEIARKLQRAQPKSALGLMVEADVELDRKQPDAAIAVLRRAVPLAGGGEAAVRLDTTLRATGRAAEADRAAPQWVKDQPRDSTLRAHLGEIALAGGNFAPAEAHYRAVLEARPDHVLALNNLAWLLARQGKPGALPLAERANRLLPDRAPLMDTLALALLADGQAQRAAEVQKKAVAAFPNDPGLKLTLAKVYIKLGDRDHARHELEGLAKLGDKFPAQGEIATLMKSL